MHAELGVKRCEVVKKLGVKRCVVAKIAINLLMCSGSSVCLELIGYNCFHFLLLNQEPYSSFHHVRGGLFLATKVQKIIYMAKNKLIFMHFLSD